MKTAGGVLDVMIEAALAAGATIMAHWDDPVRVLWKSDSSPVTAADAQAEEAILTALARACPGVPVLAEESAEAGRIPALDGAFFCVDPLDGTKSFIDRGRDFAVCVGLVAAGRPVAGVVYGPAIDRLYAGAVAVAGEVTGLAPDLQPAPGAWAWRTRAHRRVDAGVRLAARPVDPAALRAAVSRSHPAKATDAWLSGHQVRERIKLGSALKFGLVAEGGADVYPRIGGQTREWDNAAGEALLIAAGGRVVERGGAPPRYGRAGENFLTRAFVAMGQASDAVALALAPESD